MNSPCLLREGFTPCYHAEVPTTTNECGYYIGCTTALLPPFFGQKKGLTAPSISVELTARFGATARVSRGTRVNVPFRSGDNLLWE